PAQHEPVRRGGARGRALFQTREAEVTGAPDLVRAGRMDRVEVTGVALRDHGEVFGNLVVTGPLRVRPIRRFGQLGGGQSEEDAAVELPDAVDARAIVDRTGQRGDQHVAATGQAREAQATPGAEELRHVVVN